MVQYHPYDMPYRSRVLLRISEVHCPKAKNAVPRKPCMYDTILPAFTSIVLPYMHFLQISFWKLWVLLTRNEKNTKHSWSKHFLGSLLCLEASESYCNASAVPGHRSQLVFTTGGPWGHNLGGGGQLWWKLRVSACSSVTCTSRQQHSEMEIERSSDIISDSDIPTDMLFCLPLMRPLHVFLCCFIWHVHVTCLFLTAISPAMK